MPLNLVHTNDMEDKKMADIKDKIKKLLALATSPNENEARAALLKARELMAKYKLEEYDLESKKDASVVDELVGVSCTAMTNGWITQLATEIAKRYCCTPFIQRRIGGKRRWIGFIGLEDDFAVCKQVFLYACEFVLDECDNIRRIGSLTRCTTDIRELCNAYGYGFVKGLHDSFEEQDRMHNEYALVLVPPDPVLEASRYMGEPQALGGSDGSKVYGSSAYSSKGYVDGKMFDPMTKLEG